MMKKALLIGINDYPNGNRLTGCVEDINNLKAVIERNSDGKVNFYVKLMPDEQSSEKAMDAIKELFNDTSDMAMLYFSGHGYVNDTGAEIVFPDNIRTTGSYYKGIQMKDIMEVVNASKVRNKIVILDCCHSGNMGKYKLEETGSLLSTGVSILTACREDETAMEMGGHGIFTEQLCEALRGGAADFLGNITMGGVYAYIDRAFGAWGQRPIFKTNVTEFAPIKTVTPNVPLSEILKLTDLFETDNSAIHLDPSFEFTNDPKEEHKLLEPYAISENVAKFKTLQKLQSVGFVKPVGEEHMYFAAMNSKSCILTELGKYYWRLVKHNKI
jgi:hypothetical protein